MKQDGAGSKQRRAGTLVVAAIVIGLAVPLLVLEIGLRFLPVATGLATLPVNAEQPLRRFAANRDFVFSAGWNFVEATRGHVNNAGFISKLDYDSTSTTPLFALLGDSYVEALMVPWDSTVQGRLTRAAGGQGRVYNFAASGAPLSEYLAQAEFACRHYRPTGVGVVVVANDFDESLLRYKTEAGFHYFKEGADGSLTLVRRDYRASLLRQVLRRSALFRYLFLNVGIAERLSRRTVAEPAGARWVGNTSASMDSIRVATSKRAIDEFFTELPQRACVPIDHIALVVDGTRPELYDAAALAAVSDTYFPVMRRYFIAEAARRGFEVVDLEPAFMQRFARDGRRFEFPTDAHWGPHGHEVATEAFRGSAAFGRVFGLPATDATR